MEAFSISPVTANHQTATPPGTPPGLRGLGDIFAALLQEATIRLDALPADLASFEARRTNDAPPHRVSAAETISSLESNNRRDDAGSRARSVESDVETARDPVEPIAPAEEYAEVADDGEAAAPAPEQDAESGAAAADEMPEPDETDRWDTQLAEGANDEAPAPAMEDQTEPALEEIAVPATLPVPAQPMAAAAALGAAQALGAGEAAVAMLARAATRAQVPAQAAQQAQAASTMVPAATKQFGAEVGATRVQITPAAVVAQPNAALGGGAAVAALAAEAGQAVAQNGAQNAQAGASTAASQMLAAATASTGQNQARPGNRAGSLTGGPVTGGQVPASDAANTTQSATIAQNGSSQNGGAQNGGAQNSGATAHAAHNAVTAVEATPASGLQGLGQGATGPAAGAPGSPNPQNAQTPFAASNNQQAGNSATPGGLSAEASASEAGVQNRLAQNARTGTAQSLGAPVLGTDGSAGAESRQQTGTSQTVADAAPGTRSVALESNQNNTTQNNTAPTARADGLAQAGVAAQNTPSATTAAADRVMATASVQRAEGAGPVNANNPTAAGTFGLTQAAARTPQILPAQARPATAASLPANQVAVHIQRAVAAGQNRISISLHPAELGQIDVKLNIGNDGAVKAIVSVERPETFEMLQRDARGLEKALQEAGLKTDSGSLSFNLKGQSEEDTASGNKRPEADSHDAKSDTPAESEPAPDTVAAPPNGAERVLDMHV